MASSAPLFTVYSNTTAITVPDLSQSQSTIAVAGTSGPISSLTLTLNGLSMPAGTQDLNILLVGPGGQNLVFLSDVGGLFDTTSNVNITLSDAAAASLPTTGGLASGTFKPTDIAEDPDTFSPAPPVVNHAPPQGGSTFTTIFGGLSGAAVNGNWTIYLKDDTGTAGAQITVSGGWSMDIVTTPAAVPTTTTLISSSNPSNTNQAVTFTSTTTAASTVNTGVVNFVNTTSGTTVCGNVAVNASGVATCPVPANTLTQGRYSIQATYVGNASFSTSSGSVTQTVNFPTSQVGNTFTNAGGISIPDAGIVTATPYPSNITVSGLTGSISKVTLTLTNASFPSTNDHNFLLVGPAGQTYLFWSDAGGSVASNGITVTLDDSAATQLPNSGSIATGTYRPADYVQDSELFPSPAPAPPFNAAPPGGAATFASVFGGAAPNGTWSLYAHDDTGTANTSSIGSWSLTFTTTGDSATTTVLTSNPNPSTTAQPFTLTATVTSVATVNSGTVTFRRGATILCASVPVVSGTAMCNQPAYSQGDYVLTADYNGSPGQFNISSGSVTQQVNSPTIRTGNNFANNGGITIPNSTIGNPYPSRIIVSGLGGTISKVTATLNGVTTTTPDDNDFLLVGPGGQKFLMMGDAGGSVSISNVNLTLDDAAASQLPDATVITSGTWRPASYAGSDIFPAPAPAAPYNPASPDGTGTFANIFNGIVPNGTWSLYALEDAGDANPSSVSGWSLTFTLAPAATTTTVSSSANPSYLGQSVTFTANVSTAGLGTPSGNVQFFDGGTPIGGPVALNAAGQAQVSTASLTSGSHSITAQYAGDAPSGFNASTGGTTQNVRIFTAGEITLSGRVFGSGGRGVTNARVYITEPSGETRVIVTGRNGSYRFEGLEAGKTYVIRVESARFLFAPKTVSVSGDLADLDFIPE